MNEEKTTTPGPEHLSPNVAAALCYFLWMVGGIVFYLTSKNEYVRFHAMQSLLFSAAIAVIYVFLMVFGFMLWFLLGIVSILIYTAVFAVWLLLMIKAYQGEKFKLPYLGQMAEKLIK
ncbi:MAG: DUF4870 domain-containing protein [Candidatus Berkelbacteria bacterium]